MLLRVTIENTGGKPRARIREAALPTTPGELSKVVLIRGPGSQFIENLLRFNESRSGIEEIAQAALELGCELQKAETLATL